MVRRTAVAEVQAIIANKSTATPIPAATATPKPTCAGAIWWTEARAHTGESRTVEGEVVAIRQAPGGTSLLEIGQTYPDPTSLMLLATGDASRFGGKRVCATGRIGIVEGRLTLQVQDVNALTVVD
jgi:hypothetical protein